MCFTMVTSVFRSGTNRNQRNGVVRRNLQDAKVEIISKYKIACWQATEERDQDLLLLMEKILHQFSFSHYLQGFIHPRWCRISSSNSSTVIEKYMAQSLHIVFLDRLLTCHLISVPSVLTLSFLWLIHPD